MRYLTLFVLLGILFIVPAAQATPITFSTGQAGAQTQIDVNHSTIINFDVLTGQIVTEIIGNFTMKRGTKTTENTFFSLWSEYDGTGNLIQSVFLEWDDFTQHFAPIEFPHLKPLNLGPGSYSIAVRSPAVDTQDEAYFIKGLDAVAVNPPGIIGSPTVAAVPEPTSLLLLGTGLGVIGLASWRRRK